MSLENENDTQYAKEEHKSAMDISFISFMLLFLLKRNVSKIGLNVSSSLKKNEAFTYLIDTILTTLNKKFDKFSEKWFSTQR